MDNFSLIERGVHRVKESFVPALAGIRRKQLKRTDFTIISNNCWAGKCYEYFGLEKKTPTVGMYFFADDYIHFIDNLEFYTSKEINIITAQDSRHFDELKRRNQQDIPIGQLDDNVEVVFLHYHNPEIAKDKWMRRIGRINYDNLIFKFSFMNQCTDSHIHQFEKICLSRGVKHFEFVSHPFDEYKNAYYIAPFQDDQIGNDTFYWNRYFNVTAFLNEG